MADTFVNTAGHPLDLGEYGFPAAGEDVKLSAEAQKDPQVADALGAGHLQKRLTPAENKEAAQAAADQTAEDPKPDEEDQPGGNE